MASPTLTPNDQEHDEKLNPSQQDFLRDFENRPALSDDDLASRRGDHSGGSSQERVADKEKQAVGDSAAGKAAIGAASTAASAVASPIAGRAVKLLGKIKTKKGGVGALIVGLLLAGAILIMGFMGPGLLIVQMKEVMADKFNDVATVMDERQNSIIRKKLQGMTTSSCTIKVKCRYKGMTDRQIRKLERTGDIKVEAGEKNRFGYRPVSKLVTANGVEITATNYRQVIRNNPVARGYMIRAFNPRIMTYATNAFDSFARKVDVSKRKKLSGSSPERLQESMKNNIKGVDADGNRIGRPVLTKTSEGYVDSNGNQYTNAEAEKINSAAAEFEKQRNNIASSGKRAALSIAKSSTITAITGGAGVVDALCTGYYVVQAVGYGAKILSAQQLIRYAYVFMNTADAIKAGDATAEEVEFIGKIMTDIDKNGKSFTDSFGYRYSAFGDTDLPVAATEEETLLQRAAIMQYSVGSGLGGTLLNFNSQLNKVTGNAPQKVCGVMKNPLTQVGLVLGGILLTIGTGGTNLAPGLVTTVTVSAVLAGVIGIAVPILQNIAAGNVVGIDTIGGESGDAVTAGMGALNAQVSQAHGLSPLTVDQAVAYQQDTEETLLALKESQRAISNPLDIYDSSSVAYSVATSINSYIPKNIHSLISSPLSILGSATRSLTSPAVSAAEDPAAQFKICTDEEYTAKNYAVDPFCNIRYGLTDQELAMDPESVADYMYGGNHIDENGAPASGEYKNYINNCITRTEPLGSTGLEGQANPGDDCNTHSEMFNNFRVYYLDTLINDTYDNEDTLGLTPEIVETTPQPTTPPSDVNIGDLKSQYQNGRIPDSALCTLGSAWPGEKLHCSAKTAFLMLNAAYKARFGRNIAISDSYRSYAEQVATARRYANQPGRAARPGTSNHGWGLALDVGGLGGYGGAPYKWMMANAPQFGWVNPPWARQGGSGFNEPWHWEFGT